MPGKVVVTSGWGYLDEPREDAWERSVQMLRKVVAYAVEQGVTPAIEALQLDETNLVRSAEELEQLLDDVHDEHLAVCLDLGAAWRAGDSIDGYFKRFGERVQHLHFSDIGAESISRGATAPATWRQTSLRSSAMPPSVKVAV